MSIDPAFLAKIGLFAPLDDDERAVLAQAMVDRQVKLGEVLFRAGEPGDSMFIVVEGGIELSVKDKAGQKIVLHTPTAGEFFGELCAGSLARSGSPVCCARLASIPPIGACVYGARSQCSMLSAQCSVSVLPMHQYPMPIAHWHRYW